jgi:hypothetical protein
MTTQNLTVVIDVPRGSFIKRDDDGAVDFVSPIPCPFNYGHVPGSLAEDGDAVDAVSWDRGVPSGARRRLRRERGSTSWTPGSRIPSGSVPMPH